MAVRVPIGVKRDKYYLFFFFFVVFYSKPSVERIAMFP